MSAESERFDRVAADFTRRAQAVPATAWSNPAPCEGWLARDVVGHLVQWVPGYLAMTWELPAPEIPPVGDDPAASWAALRDWLHTALHDPGVATRRRDGHNGPVSFEQEVDQICTNDVFLHTWDLARAAGLDETLDAAEVHSLLVGMEPYDQMLRDSGHYGPRVQVADDADEQTKLLAFIGRRP